MSEQRNRKIIIEAVNSRLSGMDYNEINRRFNIDLIESEVEDFKIALTVFDFDAVEFQYVTDVLDWLGIELQIKGE